MIENLNKIMEDEIRAKMKDGGYHKYIDVIPCFKQVKLDGSFDVEDLIIISDTIMKYNREIDEQNIKYHRDIADRWFNECQAAGSILGINSHESLVDAAKRLSDELNALKNKKE